MRESIEQPCEYYEEYGPGGHAWMCLGAHAEHPTWHYLVPVAKTA